MVSEWTRQRARGERVPVEPPSLSHDGQVTATSRMGRIDSPAGRRMAERDAAEAAKQQAAEAKKRAAEEKAAAALAAKAAAEAPAPVETAVVPAPAPVAVQAPPAEKPGLLGNMTKRITNMFGS